MYFYLPSEIWGGDFFILLSYPFFLQVCLDADS